ncbi:hypothetical protein FOZ60_009985 [Perkinsus olseni]|uniref:Uncharacterized protein n=1 Tax=Perkinsus olseni TaxID=32597 RepID=A0A7J6PDJ6_PEROL|nr:hypothetical protein FOZ60_009985 [Perkinsus olseni]
MRYIPSLSIIALTVVKASIDDPAEAPAKKSFGHSIKRFLSRSKSRKDVAPVHDHAFFYNLHRPQKGSEFSSLSASNGPADIPGHKSYQAVLHGFLPSPTKLEVVRGEVGFGEISLKFVEEAISGDGGESTAFVRLVEAKCPVIEDILAPPTGLLRYYAYDYSFPSAMDATVFPADIRGVQLGSDSDEEEDLQSRLLDPRLSEGSGMYEIRINGKSDDALKKALELLYAAVPAPSWARKTADLSTMTANEYLILTLCLHIRGGDSPVATHPSTTFGPVEKDLSGWVITT